MGPALGISMGINMGTWVARSRSGLRTPISMRFTSQWRTKSKPGAAGGFSAHADFIEGLQLEFNPFHVTYAFIKTFLFAMLLATIPAYHGYYMKGGALGVGKASTTSFVWTSVAIIVMNSFVTNLLLT